MFGKFLFFASFCIATASLSAEPEVFLYYKDGCSHCHQVIDHLNREGIEIPVMELSEDPAYREHIRQMIGKVRVPCLVVDGKPIIGARNIKRWLEHNTVQARYSH